MFEFNKEIISWMNNSNNTKILLFVTKCCGYGFIVPIYKKLNLKDLYEFVSLEHDYTGEFFLYKTRVDMESKSKVIMPNSTNIIDWIKNNRNNLECITKVPDPIVYRIWFDDGHDHSKCKNE